MNDGGLRVTYSQMMLTEESTCTRLPSSLIEVKKSGLQARTNGRIRPQIASDTNIVDSVRRATTESFSLGPGRHRLKTKGFCFPGSSISPWRWSPVIYVSIGLSIGAGSVIPEYVSSLDRHSHHYYQLLSSNRVKAYLTHSSSSKLSVRC